MTQAHEMTETARIPSEHPPYDPSAPLQFVVNGEAGRSDTDATKNAIESGLAAGGRQGSVRFAGPGELERVAREAVSQALRDRSAVVAVGGDGTINSVAQVAHAAGCILGLIPQGTFNYFAREHGVPFEIGEALPWLLRAGPAPARVAAVNERLFLVNASVGLYPELLEDRERWEARFGRSRVISLGAAITTLLRAQSPIRVRVSWEQRQRNVRTLTLFVGSNRFQLEKLGLLDERAEADGAADRGETGPAHLTAIIVKPVGTAAMLGLMMRGAMGQMGRADGLEHFRCKELVMEPAFVFRGRTVKVAYDGEVTWMRAPIVMRVLPTPLWLLKAASVAA